MGNLKSITCKTNISVKKGRSNKPPGDEINAEDTMEIRTIMVIPGEKLRSAEDDADYLSGLIPY